MELFHFILWSCLQGFATITLVYWFYKRRLPLFIQGVLNDVGSSFGEQLQETLSAPTISKAMGIIGKRSGEVRADDALRNKVAGKLLENQPLLQKVLDYFDVSPLEGLKIINDPMVSGLIGKYLSGGQATKALRSIAELEL